MDRMLRNYQRLLSHVEEGFLYQSLLEMPIAEASKIISEHEQEVQNAGTIIRCAIAYLISAKNSGLLSIFFNRDKFLTAVKVCPA